MTDRYLDTAGAALFVGFSTRTLEAWRSERRRGGPAFSMVGRRARYRLSDLDAWMQAQRQTVKA
ncbi:hypothetical protein BH10PSE1_BH10PSE1_28340 [soil metagenome]